MTLLLDLPPAAEAKLNAAATRVGTTPETYLLRCVERLPETTGDDGLTDEEFERLLDELASESDHLPILPPEANSREWIYGEHP